MIQHRRGERRREKKEESGKTEEEKEKTEEEKEKIEDGKTEEAAKETSQRVVDAKPNDRLKERKKTQIEDEEGGIRHPEEVGSLSQHLEGCRLLRDLTAGKYHFQTDTLI